MCRLLISFENEGRELKPFGGVWDWGREESKEKVNRFLFCFNVMENQEFCWVFLFSSLSFATSPDRISLNLIGG